MISFESIVSKIAAGGLSAGIFLFWWPEHVPGDGVAQLVLRGLLWTLAFELLFVAFAPLERIVTTRLERRTAARRAKVRERLAAAPAPARTGGAVALACLGLAAPVTLLAGAPHELVKDAVPTREVVKQVVVAKPVVRREVIVKRVVVRAPAANAPGATAVSSASVRTAPAAPQAKRTAAPAKKPAVKQAETKPAKAEEPVTALAAPEPATPTPTPAPTTAAATTTDAPAAASAPAAAPQP